MKDPRGLCEDVSELGHWGGGSDYRIKIYTWSGYGGNPFINMHIINPSGRKTEATPDYIIGLIEQSYNYNKRKL